MSDDRRRPDDRVAELGERASGALAVALEPAPVSPSDSLRDRLMRSALPGARFERFACRIAALMEIGQERASQWLGAIDDAASWAPMGPGVELFHIEGGPSVANAITGFVRVAPGAMFPPHRHVGDEVVLVIQGGYRDSDGSVYGLGAEVPGAPDHEHHLTALPGTALIYLAIVFGGVEVGGELIPPGDPRA
jgi:hypothetical protein